MKKMLMCIVLFLSVSLAFSGQSRLESVSPSGDRCFRIFDTEVRRIRSRIIGDDFDISISFPRKYRESKKQYPVLYVLDATGMFPPVVSMVGEMSVGGELPEMLIVGIGYRLDYGDSAAFTRFRDLTPTMDTMGLRSTAAMYESLGLPVPKMAGRADLFLRFIKEEVIPLAERDYRASPADRALAGYSLGGLFVLYAFASEPITFNRYIAGSPSLWWDRGVMLQKMGSLRAIPPNRNLFVSIGLLEEPEAFKSYAMVSNVRALESVLRTKRLEGLTWRVHYFEEETHGSGIWASISRGLRFVHGTWPAK